MARATNMTTSFGTARLREADSITLCVGAMSMKTCKITIMCFVLLVLSLKARPVDMRLTYDDFQKQSDYILLLSVSNIVELTDIPAEFVRLHNGCTCKRQNYR